VDRTERLEAILADAVSYPRLGAWLLGLFGGLAVLLSAIGLGGTLAWSVAERRREIGVRMALGASPGAIRTLVVRHSMLLTSFAIAIGLTGAWFASRLKKAGSTASPARTALRTRLAASPCSPSHWPPRTCPRDAPRASIR
jgi:predicted lysophospholipase L1 biosynthesis ABC-type transport system permease subunit